MEEKQVFEVFENAGKTPGLEIWRIEDFNPVPVPKNEHGKFYSGDSYVVLNTRKTNSTCGMSWDIHFWLGKDTSQDEAGSAAILSVELDEMLDGRPVQHRELQGHESQQFLSYFKAGIRYLPGGVASGFTHVTTNGSSEDTEPVLYQVKGKRNIRVRQVEAHVRSMNHADCFILDAGQDIYVWVGSRSKRVERIKAITAANMIRDQDHGGRSKVHIIDEFSDDGEVSSFFRRLGSGDHGSIEDGESSDDDEEDDTEDVALYKVSDDSGKVTITKVASSPLSQSLLNSADCYVLDARSAGLYTWIGHEASKDEKVEAVKRAQQFLKENHRPSWTRIQRVVEDGEPASFKQFFRDWNDEGVFDGLFSPDRLAAAGINNEDTATALPESELRHLARREGPAVGFMPDDGRSGSVKVFRVDDTELVPVPEEHYGRFFGGDSYVISYTYCVSLRERHVVYFWQGEDSSQSEKAAAAIHAVRLVDEFGGDAMQVRVTQGHEPRHFLSIFRGKMIVFLGGHQSGFRDIRDYDTFDAQAARLFQVRGTCDADVRIHQVPAKTASLNSDDAFVLDTPDKTYLWLGQEASDAEREAAEAACRLLTPGREPQLLREGSEPDEWWSALGGIGEYTYTGHHQSSLRHNHASMPPRLFHCQITSKGRFRVYEVGDYTQDDLAEDDVLLLDSGDEVYVWIGKHSSEKERELSLKTAEDYLRLSPVPNRQNAPVIVVKQNEEPAGFTTLFPDWDPDYWEGVPSYEHIKSKLLES